MLTARDETTDVIEQGELIYERDLRSLLEPSQIGQFVVIDVDTGRYEVDADEREAIRRVRLVNPAGRRYLKRVGFRCAHRIGGHLRPDTP